MQSPEKLAFIKRHRLPLSYLEQASKWFEPLVENLVEHQNSAKKCLILGINGCQGSGKTTLADYLVCALKEKGLNCLAISIDDFYLDHAQRQKLSKEIHPLLTTRGVPGTHDLDLAFSTLTHLAETEGFVSVPNFDKATDNKVDKQHWKKIQAPIDIIILEGWCVGIPAQEEAELEQAVNALELEHDSQGTWRHYVNDQLSKHYHCLWKQIDTLIMLKAPAFDCVYQWRLEQEEKLLQKSKEEGLSINNRIMSPKEIRHFVQHYERLTRHALACLPERCQHVFELDSDRNINRVKTRIT